MHWGGLNKEIGIQNAIDPRDSKLSICSREVVLILLEKTISDRKLQARVRTLELGVSMF
jgi:hypothetical protein